VTTKWIMLILMLVYLTGDTKKGDGTTTFMSLKLLHLNFSKDA
jgi:hypothetical protein